MDGKFQNDPDPASENNNQPEDRGGHRRRRGRSQLETETATCTKDLRSYPQWLFAPSEDVDQTFPLTTDSADWDFQRRNVETKPRCKILSALEEPKLKVPVVEAFGKETLKTESGLKEPVDKQNRCSENIVESLEPTPTNRSPAVCSEEVPVKLVIPLPDPVGPYPIKATCFRNFLDKFELKPKLQHFEPKVMWKYPSGDEWECRMVNLNTYYHVYEVSTLDFEWNNADFLEKHKSLQCQMNALYSFVKHAPDFRLNFESPETILSIKAGVVDLGEEGFYRCSFNLADGDANENSVTVRLVDLNRPMTVSPACIYQCLEEFADLPAKYNDLFLNHFAIVQPMDECRQQIFKYFKEGGEETIYKVKVQFWNEHGIPVVDLYTLGCPPAYVNDLIAVNVVDVFPGQVLPKSPSGVNDVLIPYVECTGEVALQIQTRESAWFTDITTENTRLEVLEMIRRYHHSEQPMSLNGDTIYYAMYSLDEKFYRVKLVRLEPDDDCEVGQDYKIRNLSCATSASTTEMLFCRYIDYGNSSFVDPKVLIPADCVHPLLGRFKPQCTMARLANVSSLNPDEFFEYVDEHKIVNIEVLSDGTGNGNSLPVVDILCRFKDRPQSSQTRLSQVLAKDSTDCQLKENKKTRGQDSNGNINVHKATSTSKLHSLSPYDKRPSQFDSLEVIDMQYISWSHPPQTSLVLEKGTNVLVTITAANHPQELVLQAARDSANPDAWDRMEDEITLWRQHLKIKYRDFELNEFLEQRVYCYLDPTTKKFIRVFYAAKEDKTSELPENPLYANYLRRLGNVDTAQKLKDREILKDYLKEVIVYAVDYAKYMIVRKGELRLIIPRFCQLPPRAIRGRLPQTADWTNKEMEQFEQAVKGRTFCFRIEDDFTFTEDGIPRVTGEFYHRRALDLNDTSKTYYELHHDVPQQELKIPLEKLGISRKATFGFQKR